MPLPNPNPIAIKERHNIWLSRTAWEAYNLAAERHQFRNVSQYLEAIAPYVDKWSDRLLAGTIRVIDLAEDEGERERGHSPQ